MNPNDKEPDSSQEHVNRLQAIFEAAIDGIITIDDSGIIESVNPAAAALFLYAPEEIVGENVSMLMPEPDRSRHNTYLTKYLTTGERKIIGIGREVMGLRKNGERFPFRLSISEVKLNETRIFTGIIHDLTSQKENEERLRRYAAELERSNRDLQDFAYISSHDLQEPLRKIRTFGGRVATMEAGNLDPKSEDYLNRMLNAAERMQQLINDLLTFSRVSTEAKPFEQTPLEDIVAEVMVDLELLIGKSHAEVKCYNLPSIEADRTQMRQLFQNLIANAIKFRNPDVPPKIQITSNEIGKPELKARKLPGKWVQIEVKDNGIGFEQSYSHRIFDIFQRLNGKKYTGSGIGLTICKRIVTRHGGFIHAISKPGGGTTFVIDLPYTQLRNKEDMQ